jgi:hypothetical protein
MAWPYDNDQPIEAYQPIAWHDPDPETEKLWADAFATLFSPPVLDDNVPQQDATTSSEAKITLKFDHIVQAKKLIDEGVTLKDLAIMIAICEDWFNSRKESRKTALT